MKSIARALLATIWLGSIVVPAASADDSDSPWKRDDAQIQAYYSDSTNFAVSVSGYRIESNGGPFNLAQIVVVDFATSQWSVCLSEDPSVQVSPSGHAELRFTPQIDAGCPSDAPIVVSCAPSADTIISSGTINTTYRGTSDYGIKVNHGNVWTISRLRCSIVVFGAEYLAQSAYATLGRSLAVR